MGSVFGKSLSRLFVRKKTRVIMVGLAAAGKTSILYKLNSGDSTNIIRTDSFIIETVNYKNFSFIVWDVSSQDKIRLLYKHFYKTAPAIIFVVDSSDRDRIGEAREELARMLNEDELADAVLLVFANKQDLPRAMSVSEIRENLHLLSLRNRNWYIQASCATHRDGLYEGLDWLTQNLKRK